VLDPFRDLGSVVDLMVIAFEGRLDPAGEATLERMRRFADSGPLVQWAWALLGRSAMAPGLVWVANDRVIGNVSVRRARGAGGYLIGNVVVHPEHRGQGIGSALMKRAIQMASRRGAHWVGLEVRADNDAARRLYDRLAFREVGRTHHLLRLDESPVAGRGVPSRPMRRVRRADGDALVALMRATFPEEQRPLLEIQEDDYRPTWTRRVRGWLTCEDETWWVIPDGQGIAGAFRTVRKRAGFPNQLEVLTRPDEAPQATVDLVRRGMASLAGWPRKPIATCVPEGAESLIGALRGEGFRESRVLVQMKRELRRRVPVRVT
jgi:ribosomal-protein-alanine N-acetyltransferase